MKRALAISLLILATQQTKPTGSYDTFFNQCKLFLHMVYNYIKEDFHREYNKAWYPENSIQTEPIAKNNTDISQPNYTHYKMLYKQEPAKKKFIAKALEILQKGYSVQFYFKCNKIRLHAHNLPEIYHYMTYAPNSTCFENTICKRFSISNQTQNYAYYYTPQKREN